VSLKENRPGLGAEAESETPSDTDIVATATPYADGWQTYQRLGWPGVLPLPYRAKIGVPAGYTGYDGADPSYPDMLEWGDDLAPNRGGGNLALRMPANVIGIDIDAYGVKTGAQTIAEAEQRWGALPAGPYSTSRSDGASRIRFYRVQPGTRLRSILGFDDLGLGGVEIIQRHHRYAIVWPSTHRDTGALYRWFGAGGQVLDEPPAPGDLPELSAAWLDAMRDDSTPIARAELGAAGDDIVRSALTVGEPSPRVAARLSEALSALNGCSRHDNTLKHVGALLRYGKRGEPGVAGALASLRDAYVPTVADDRDGGAHDATEEFNRMISNAGPMLATPDDRDNFADWLRQIVPEQFAEFERKQAAMQQEPPTAIAPDPAGGVTVTNQPANAGWSFVNGASFILDIPATIPALWGEGNEVLWAEGESLMIAGPLGLGKTTMAGLLIRAQLGVGKGTVLDLPVAERPGKILYLAMDRPAQIARALARQFNQDDRAVLAERLVIWKGPPPADVAKNPELLVELAQAAGAHTVYLDSVKDAAIGLSEDEVGAGYNRARQHLLADGRELSELHHTTKRGANGGPPTSVADIYGSAWIANGTGSIILLAGDPGDPIVGFRHVRTPAEEVGPFQLSHDQAAGLMTVLELCDVAEMAYAAGADGVTAKAAAVAMFETKTPTRGQVEKARRKLDKEADAGRLTRVDTGTGRGKTSVWFPS
jgi:Bifunctional DNA primase/polymerase, N-terminal/AAA domain